MEHFLEPIVNEVQEVLSNVDVKELEVLIDYIQKDRRIFVDGEGRSGYVGKCFAMRLMHLGFEVYVMGETNTPSFQKDDLLVCISGSGNTEAVVINANKAKAKEATIMTITNNADSVLAKLSKQSVVLDATVRGDVENRKSIQLLGSLFDQSVHLLLDSVCLTVSQRDQITNQEANQQHI